MEELQLQVNKLKREVDSLKSAFSIPYDVEGAFRARLKNFIYLSTTLDFGNTGTQTNSELSVTIYGAAVGDPVFLGIPSAAIVGNTGGLFIPYVSAIDTVTIRFINPDVTSSLNPGSGTFKIIVFKNYDK